MSGQLMRYFDQGIWQVADLRDLVYLYVRQWGVDAAGVMRENFSVVIVNQAERRWCDLIFSQGIGKAVQGDISGYRAFPPG